MSSTFQRRRYRSNSHFGPPHLDRLSDDELLNMRICDLGVRIANTPLEDRIAKLNSELQGRGVRFRPHFWLADEWFTPDGVPGIAIPFFLAHPRLMRLESKQMIEVEGGTEDSCMKILRHEAGHAIDNAYRLRRKKRWRDMFGPASQPYPDYYTPKPYSRNFVLHLDLWYAQSHPVEDFAETFAVWLKPRSPWRKKYAGWPALRKLEFVDQLINDIKEETPPVRCRAHVDQIRKNKTTLRDYYARRREHYGLDCPSSMDRELKKLFSADPAHASKPSAASFLRRVRADLLKSVSHWTGEYQYAIDQVLKEMIERCRDLNLRVHQSERVAERETTIMLTMQAMTYLHNGRERVAI